MNTKTKTIILKHIISISLIMASTLTFYLIFGRSAYIKDVYLGLIIACIIDVTDIIYKDK